MCGRYTFTQLPPETEIETPSSETSIKPRYNMAPTQLGLICTAMAPHRYQYMRWGLIPHWAKDEKIGTKMINARSETVLEKPAFRHAVRTGRVLVWADGFYEWKKEGKDRQPYRITLRDEQPFFLAGIATQWMSAAGSSVQSFSILTISPNELMAPIHDRMPVILSPTQASQWVDPTLAAEELVANLTPYESSDMRAYAVAPTVGQVRIDRPDLIEPAGRQGNLFA